MPADILVYRLGVGNFKFFPKFVSGIFKLGILASFLSIDNNQLDFINIYNQPFPMFVIRHPSFVFFKSKPIFIELSSSINFYEINGEFRIADLPGYGYAKVISISQCSL